MAVAAAKKEPADTFASRRAELERQVHDICRGQEYAEQIIARHVKAVKASQPSLPEVNIAMTVRGFDECSCRVALKVLNEQAAALELEAKQNGSV